MVYYLQQNVAVLSQISQQISFLSPQFPIPSTPPPPFPAFNPSASDVRVNVFWFMALIFSLSAALLATLVQQWVRDYMHVFQRYNDSLKSARIRQYLYEGCEGWHMPVVAETVPGLLHISLFLFFVGLGDFVLKINTTVGISTIIPISMSGVLYIFTTFAPVIYPQSPYQNSFSGLIWYMVQKSKLFGWRFKNEDGESTSVDANLVQGRLQLAMEETEERQGRDEQGISWLIDNMTSDAEMDSLVMAIPGSFNGEWGIDVWKGVFGPIGYENMNTDRIELHAGSSSATDDYAPTPIITEPSCMRTGPNVLDQSRSNTRSHPSANAAILPPSPNSPNIHSHVVTIHGRSVVCKLRSVTARMLVTCQDPPASTTKEIRRKLTRGCVETAAFLVCFTDTEISSFGDDILTSLGKIGEFEEIRGLSSTGAERAFVTRWTCLSIIAIRRPRG